MEIKSSEGSAEKLPRPILINPVSIETHAVGYDIQNEKGANIGYIALVYNLESKKVSLAGINIDESERGKKYGKAVYEQIPHLPPPIEGNYIFVSSQPDQVSPDAKRVWESLVKDGKAVLREDGYYQMID